jgi:hypothetical protein
VSTEKKQISLFLGGFVLYYPRFADKAKMLERQSAARI